MLTSALHIEEWEQLLKPYILWWSLALVQAHIYLPLPPRCGKLHGCVSQYLFTKIRSWSIWELGTFGHKSCFCCLMLAALQVKLNEEKSARHMADLQSQEKERQMSMLSVDYRQIQQRLQKLEGEHRQENEKVWLFTSFQFIGIWHADFADVTDVTHWCWIIFPQSVVLVLRKQVVLWIFVYTDINLSTIVQTWFVWNVCYCISSVSISEN